MWQDTTLHSTLPTLSTHSLDKTYYILGIRAFFKVSVPYLIEAVSVMKNGHKNASFLLPCITGLIHVLNNEGEAAENRRTVIVISIPCIPPSSLYTYFRLYSSPIYIIRCNKGFTTNEINGMVKKKEKTTFLKKNDIKLGYIH